MTEIDLKAWEDAVHRYKQHQESTKLIEQFNHFKESKEKVYNDVLINLVFSVYDIAKKRNDMIIASKVLSWASKNVEGQIFSTLKTSIEASCLSSDFANLIEAEHMQKIIEEDYSKSNFDIIDDTDLIINHIKTTKSLKETNKLIYNLKKSKRVQKKTINQITSKIDAFIQSEGHYFHKRELKQFGMLAKNRLYYQILYKRMIYILIGIGVTVGAFFIADYVVVLDSNININTSTITITYSEDIPKDLFEIEIQKIRGYEQVNITDQMFSYDPNLIGLQSASITYRRQTKYFNLIIEPLQIETPQITHDSGMLYINALEIVTHFTIMVNDQMYTIQNNQFDLNQLPAGSYHIRAIAVAPSERYSDSEYSNSIVIDKLLQVIDVFYDNGQISWTPVEDADYYSVWVNDQYFTSDDHTIYFEFIQRDNIIRVVAHSQNIDTLVSDAKEAVFIRLESVHNIIYSNYRLSWQSSEAAYDYIIHIDDQVFQTKDQFIDIILEPGEYLITIQVVDLEEVVINSSIASKELNFQQLKTPSILLIEDNDPSRLLLAISRVEHADVYEIYIKKYMNDIDYDEQVIMHEGLDLIIIQVEIYSYFEISLKAMNAQLEYETSHVSQPFEVRKLGNIENITYIDDRLSWDIVSHATSYHVWINQNLYQVTTNVFEHIFEAGNNTVMIQALGTPENTVRSNIFQEEFIKLNGVTNITYQNQRLQWDSIETNYTFLVIVNGNEFQTTNTYIDIVLNAGVHDISIQVIDTTMQKINSSPTEIQIGYEQLIDPIIHIDQGTISTMFIMTVESIPNATHYYVKITIYNEDEVEWTTDIVLTEQLSHTFFGSNASTKIIVKVYATDASGVYANSNESTKEFIIE